MKFFTVLFCAAFLLVGCGSDSKGQRILSKSSGKLNYLSVVMDNNLWEGKVGETIREVFAANVEGLPQDEPLFSMSQMPTEVFSGFATSNRTVLRIQKADSTSIQIKENVYAKPQTIIDITAKSSNEIISILKSNAAKYIDALKKTEITEQQKRIGLSLGKTEDIDNNLGITLKYPTAYRIAKESDEFFWIRKTLSESKGTLDIMLYEVPMTSIRKGDSTVVDIVNIRDEFGKKHINGEGDGAYMGTEDAYAPYIAKTIVDNKPAYETKGIWDMKNDWMSGPFLNYAIEDKINNRYIIAEGYAYAPSTSKRDYMFELEAILKSVKIK